MVCVVSVVFCVLIPVPVPVLASMTVLAKGIVVGYAKTSVDVFGLCPGMGDCLGAKGS